MTARQPDTPRRGGRAGWTAADGFLLLAVLCFVAGAITLIVTWYEISGLALIAEQLPYLASGGLGVWHWSSRAPAAVGWTLGPRRSTAGRAS